MATFSSSANEAGRLASIESKIDQLLAVENPSGLNFNLIALNPTYQTYASNGWQTEPQNLQALYDADISSASNLFSVGGSPWIYGEVIMFPGVPIPQYTKIELKVGIRNSAGQRSLFELAFFNVNLSSYINVWSYADNASSTQDLIANINCIIPFSWDKMRWRISDVGSWFPQSRFYDLKVWEIL